MRPRAIQSKQGVKPASRLAAGARKTSASVVSVPSPRRSGQLPEGDVRLTANIRSDLHLKLKIRAATERTTIGELIEGWVESWEGHP